MSVTTIATLESLFTADTSGLMGGLRSADNAIMGFGNSVRNVGGSLTSFGTQLGALAAPAVAVFTGATMAALNFDEAMTNANSILGLSEEAINAVSAEILAMGAHSIAGPQAVAEAYYDIVSGVTDVTTHMDILNTSIAVSEANAAGLQGVTAALVSVMNAYGFSADQAAYAGDVFTRTIQMGVVTGDELAAVLGSITPMAHAMGISLTDVGSMLAYFTTQGVSAAEATTQMSGMMNALLKPTTAMSGALATLGFSSGEAAVNALGLAGTYQALNEILGTSGLSEATGRVEAFRGALMVTNDGANEFFDTFASGSLEMGSATTQFGTAADTVEEFRQRLGQTENTTGDLTRGMQALQAGIPLQTLRNMKKEMIGSGREFARTNDKLQTFTEKALAIQKSSPADTFKRMKSEAQALAIQVGYALIPTLVSLMDTFMPLIQSIMGWVQENPRLVATIAMVAFGAAALAAVLIPLGMVISALGSLIVAFGAILGFILSPLGLIILAFAAVVAAVVALKLAWDSNFLGMQTAITRLVDAWTTGGLGAAITTFKVIAMGALSEIIQFMINDFFPVLTREILIPIAAETTRAIAQIDTLYLRYVAVPMVLTLLFFVADIGQWWLKNITTPISLQMFVLQDRVSKGAENIANAFKGAVAGLSAWWIQRITAPITAQLFILQDRASSAFWGIRTTITNVLNPIAQWVATNLVTPIATNINSIVGRISGSLWAIPTLFRATLGQVPVTIGGVTLSINELIERANRVWDATSGAWNAFKTNVAGVMNAIKDAIKPVTDAVNALIDLINSIPSLPSIPGTFAFGEGVNGISAGGGKQASLQLSKGISGSFGGNSLVMQNPQPPSGGLGTPSGGHSGGGIVINGNIYIEGVQDTSSLLDKLRLEARRRGTPVTLGGFSG